jgi:hypothetical protein
MDFDSQPSHPRPFRPLSGIQKHRHSIRGIFSVISSISEPNTECALSCGLFAILSDVRRCCDQPWVLFGFLNPGLPFILCSESTIPANPARFVELLDQREASQFQRHESTKTFPTTLGMTLFERYESPTESPFHINVRVEV